MNSSKFEIKKQERETNQGLIRRFTKRLRDSGILTNAKKSQFRKRVKSTEMRKKAVLRKLEIQKEREQQRKLGNI
ncbi:MAG: hypothetical protein Q8P12_04325 [bacterium]|jgi:hypothetical protein|nr:hypothetical protein [bacterium]